MSSESEPVGMPSMAARGAPSSFMTAPLPNCFSICWTARESADSRAGSRLTWTCGTTPRAAAADEVAEPFPLLEDEEEDEDDAEGCADFLLSALSSGLATVGSLVLPAGYVGQPASGSRSRVTHPRVGVTR